MQPAGEAFSYPETKLMSLSYNGADASSGEVCQHAAPDRVT